MEEHPIGWVGNVTGLLGGIAGIGTACAALLVAIWRHGYRAGREAEKRRRQSDLLEQLAHHRSTDP